MARRRQVKQGGAWRTLRRVTIGAVLLVGVAVAGAGGYLRYVYPDSAGPGSGERVVVDVPWGGGYETAAEQAAKAGAVADRRRFALYLRLSGFASRLKAGRHQVRDHWTPEQVARALTKPGRSEQVRVTLREGWTRFQFADELDRQGIVPREAFLAATEHPVVLARAGIVGESAEGYLFPETYHMEPGSRPARVVERLVITFRRRSGPVLRRKGEAVDRLGRDLLALEEQLGRGPLRAAATKADPDPTVAGRRAAIILASMVEAEAARHDERPLVAAVILNRLRSPEFTWRKLQIDPTVAYGCQAEPRRAPTCSDGADPLTSRHLADGENRYNTYAHPGLPPGPIGNPSLSSLEAVLTPATEDYLYFVARGDGSHVFSKTLAEHNKAVADYRSRER